MGTSPRTGSFRREGTLNRLVLIDEEDEEDDDLGCEGDEEVDADQFSLNENSTVSHQESTKADAWALTTSLHWTPAVFESQTLSVGYSIGSGTEPGEKAGSETFLQTGLQFNELDHNYYGDILESELSNLRIATV